MSNRKKQMAAQKTANRKARLAPLHEAQVARRAADRAEHAKEWNKKRTKKALSQ